jgi:hypothetical protein
MRWTNPAATELTLSVGDSITPPTVPVAIADTQSVIATNTAFANCYLEGASCSEQGQFNVGSLTYQETGGSSGTLPSWIEFIPSGESA